jgi:predicted Zn-dependent peptidase
MTSDFVRHDRQDPLTGKVLRTYRHPCGLIVKFIPRPGFTRKFAAVTVPYGSVHINFKDELQAYSVPAGTAHFLEHCVFSRDDGGGLLGKLSALGASANAYTSHTHTLYYFSAVRHFDQALGLYLDSILNPYLETDRVEAERPVILAELDQYRDDPETRCYNSLIENLYENHPVRLDIGGTVESVQAITSEDLKQVWRNFYKPCRLSMTLAGDLDEDQILQRLQTRLNSWPDMQQSKAIPLLPDEPAVPAQKEITLHMDVSTPSFLVGVKDPLILPGHEMNGRDLVVRQRAARLLLDTLISPVSPLFDQLYSQGLVNDSFGFHYSCEESFAFLACGGESSQPEKAAAALIEGLISHFNAGIDSNLFEIQKRAAAGDFVRSLDSVEHSGIVQAQCNLHDIDLFDYPAIYDNIDCTIAGATMRFLADPSCYSTAILLPAEVT